MKNGDKIILEFITELLKASPETYEEVKMTLLIRNRQKPKIEAFLRKVFELIEEKRPLMIEMKGGANA